MKWHKLYCYVYYESVVKSFIGVTSIFGGPECLIGPEGEPEKDSRFFAEPPVAFSGVLPLSPPSGLGSRDLALVDSVEAM